MSTLGAVAGGIAVAAIITAASSAAGLRPVEGLVIGGGTGLVLTLTERSRPAGLALLLASVAGMAVTSQRQRRAPRVGRLARSRG